MRILVEYVECFQTWRSKKPMLANNHIMASLEEGVNFFCLFVYFFKKEDHLKNGDISVYTNKIRPAAVLRRGQACVWEALFGWALRQCLRWPCWWWAHNFVCVSMCSCTCEREKHTDVNGKQWIREKCSLDVFLFFFFVVLRRRSI